jgi:hypothetical protein
LDGVDAGELQPSTSLIFQIVRAIPDPDLAAGTLVTQQAAAPPITRFLRMGGAARRASGIVAMTIGLFSATARLHTGGAKR